MQRLSECRSRKILPPHVKRSEHDSEFLKFPTLVALSRSTDFTGFPTYSEFQSTNYKLLTHSLSTPQTHRLLPYQKKPVTPTNFRVSELISLGHRN